MKTNKIYLNLLIEKGLLPEISNPNQLQILKTAYPNQDYPENIYEKNGKFYDIKDFMDLNQADIITILSLQNVNAPQTEPAVNSSKNNDIDRITNSLNDINTSLKSIFILFLFQFILTLIAAILCIVVMANFSYELFIF